MTTKALIKDYRTAAAVDQPLLGLLATGTASDADPERSLVTVDHPDVRVIAIRSLAGPDGSDDLQVRLQSFADQSREVTLAVPPRPSGAATTTFLGDDLDELAVSDLGERGYGILVRVPRLGSAAVRLKR